MKACRKCGIVKPARDYYKHPNMTSGRLSACKECIKEYHRQLTRDGLTQERDRLRYQNNPERREQKRQASRRWARRHPHKRQAHSKLSNAVVTGRIKPKGCEKCGGKAQGHHDDYSKPLVVRWLCPKHHAQAHRRPR